MPPSQRKTALGVFLEDLIKRFDDHVLDLKPDSTPLGQHGLAFRKPWTKLPVIDSLIAATALERDLTLVTRNESDFEPTGVKILNVWK